jgi:lysophospholipase L1-like esterase
MRSSTHRWVAVFFLLLALVAPASAQLPPEIGYVFPAGGRAGTTVEVKLGGYDWTPDMQVFVHDRRVKLEMLGPPGELLIPPPPYWFGPRSKAPSQPIPRETPARFVLPANLPPGPIRWQVANASGASATGLFIVGDGREIIEAEGRKGPQAVGELPVVVSGRLLKNEEIDQYSFMVPRDGLVSIDLNARRLGATFHGALEVREAGRLVAESVDTEGVDPALTIAARAGKEYVVSVRDIDHAGDQAYVYRLALWQGPRVVATIPLAGRRGEKRPVEFVGYGVASGAPRLESVRKEVAFPAAADVSAFGYRLETAWGIAPPSSLLVSDLPEAVAPENAGRKPTPLGIPGGVTGVLENREGEHRYSFAVKKGEHWTITAEARRFGSPLDVSLAVLGSDGKELVRADDLPGTTDVALDWIAPADGTYQVAVSDLAGTAGTRAAVYRLTVRPTADDFVLQTPAQRVGLNIGQKLPLVVKAIRTGNFKGPITLSVTGLPPGVKVPANLVIPADKPELAISLEAGADAPATASMAVISGTARIGDKDVTHHAAAPAAGNLAPRTPQENETTSLLVATTIKPRCKGEPVDKDAGRKVPRGSTFPAEVTIERLEGYTGEVVLQMASRQSYQVQGITGGEVVVPPGTPRAVYPCFMPEWLETSKTSRMAIIAVVKIADPRANVRHSVVLIEGQVTMTMEGALLKVSHQGRELTAQAGSTFVAHLRIARSARLPEPVRLELRPPEELAGTFKADAIVVPAGQADVDFPIRIAADPRAAGEQTLTIRGTAMQPGNLPVVSETAVLLTIAPPAAAPPAEPVVIVTLGDSITKGARPGVRQEETFTGLLAARLEEKKIAAKVVNAGVGNESTNGALARLDKAVLMLKPKVVVVMYGTNDSYVDKGAKDSRLTAAEYRKNLVELVDRLRAGGAEPILMTEPRWATTAKDGVGENPNPRLEEFMAACREVANEKKVTLIDHFAHWTEAEKKGTKLADWTTDGCHPNPRGHKEMADLMTPVVVKLLAGLR